MSVLVKCGVLKNYLGVANQVNRSRVCLAPATHKYCVQVHHVRRSEEDVTKWRMIYRLPLIRLVSAFNRLKGYQAILTCLGTPTVLGLEQVGQLPPSTTLVFGAIGLSGLLTLTISSYFTRNIVGVVYVNPFDTRIKLAYVDFWGKRKEIIVKMEDLKPNWEAPKTIRHIFYQPILLHPETNERLFMLQKFGMILEPEEFAEIFGE